MRQALKARVKRRGPTRWVHMFAPNGIMIRAFSASLIHMLSWGAAPGSNMTARRWRYRLARSFFAMEIVGLGSLDDDFFVIRFDDGEFTAVGIMASITARIISDYVVNEIFCLFVHELVRFTRSKEERIPRPDFSGPIPVAHFTAARDHVVKLRFR